MSDKCPKCGEPLTTKTIKKELELGSIDYPIAQVCPKCGWSMDLTGAGDIASKPVVVPEPEKEEKKAPMPPKIQPKPVPSAGINKMITVVLAILVLSGIVWAFFLYPNSQKQAEVTPEQTPTVEQTPVSTVTSTPAAAQVTPTGKSILIKVESRRGFYTVKQTIKPGDEIVWRNDGKESFTLVSSEGLFEERILDYDKEYRYMFDKTGTYSFYLKENKGMTGAVTVEP